MFAPLVGLPPTHAPAFERPAGGVLVSRARCVQSSAFLGSPTMNSRVEGSTGFNRSRINLALILKLFSGAMPMGETPNHPPSGTHPLRPYPSFSSWRAQLLSELS